MIPPLFITLACNDADRVRVRATFAANASKADCAIVRIAPGDPGGDLAWALTILATGTPVHVAILPTGNAMTPAAYAQAYGNAQSQVMAAGMLPHGGRMTWRIESVSPCGCALGFDGGFASTGLTQEAWLAEVTAASEEFLTTLQPGSVASCPLFQPGQWPAGLADKTRDAMRAVLGNQAVFGQLSFPSGYETGGDLLKYAPLFAQQKVGATWESGQQQAEALGLLWLEGHQNGAPD